MIWIRALLIAFPALLVLVLAASFLSVKLTPSPKKNQMISAGIGEARILNPIQNSTTADSDVVAYIFGSLLTYNEDLEVIGDHAESWELAQTSTVCFHNDLEAAAALEIIEEAKDRWEDWNLTNAEVTEDILTLRFSMPGTRASREILDLLDQDSIVPLHIFRITLASSARESAAHFKSSAVFGDRALRVWIDSSRAYEITVRGSDEEIKRELEEYYAANPALGAEVSPVDTVRNLDEPDIVFHLHKNIRWHDGRPFTAEDVEFTYRMIMDETVASPRRPDYELISSITVEDPHRLRVVYRKPYSPALLSWMIGLLPKHILEGKSSAWWAENFNRSPVGTGPFRFQTWRTGEYIVLERNPDYFRGAPHMDEIIIRVIPDPVSLRLSFETDQVDFWGVNPHAVGGFKQDERFELFSAPAPSYEYVGWNMRREPFSDVNVRRALAHAVDVNSIIRYIYYGYGIQSTGIFPPQMWFFNKDIEPISYDPEKAKTMLAELGWKPGPDGILAKNGRRFAFNLLTNQANEVRKDIATLVQSDLRRIGIEVKVQIFEFAVFISQYVDKGEFDAVVLGWSLGYDYDQYQLWHSSQTNPGQLNFCGYENPRADQLIEELRTTYDTEEIKKLAGELQALIYEEQPYLFLYIPESIGAMWKDSYRVRRPVEGGWKDEPVRMTAAGFRTFRDWFYRPSYKPEMRP